MISDEWKCIFVHIPRCGGTSIEAVIWPGGRSEDELWMGFISPYRNKYQTGGLQHLLARQIRREVGEERFLSYFKFAVVRNPFDRLVSQFTSMCGRPDLRAFIDMDEHASFVEYVNLIRRKRHVQWEPQSSFLYDDDGTLLVDFVGRFETLVVDAAGILERIGINRVTLPHENRSNRLPYRDCYTSDLRIRVEEMYEDDLARFDYEF